MLRCLVIGNGPNLKTQLARPQLLHKYFTFGSNKIFLSGFTPNVYCAINDLVVEQSIEQLNFHNSMKFITDRKSDLITGSIPLKSNMASGTFSFNPMNGICEGSTVTYVLLQLAFWMGFDEVGLIGVDHKYKFSGAPNERVMCEDDPNHFCKNYFSGNMWDTPDLKSAESHYEVAKKVFEESGRKIINLSEDSDLCTFPMADWIGWL